MTSEKVMEKLRKLQAMAEGAKAVGNESEALAFAAKVSELLEKYKLDMTEVELKAQEVEDPIGTDYFGWMDYDAAGLKKRRTRIHWIERLASTVARAHFCRILVHPGTSNITFVGRKSDTTVAKWMFIYLQRQAERFADEGYHKAWHYYKSLGDVTQTRGFRRSFLEGFTARIGERYQEEAARRQREYQQTNPHAIVLIKNAHEAVGRYLGSMKGISTGSSTTNRANHMSGVEAGRAAANKVNLNAKGVGGATGGTAASLGQGQRRLGPGGGK